jgi:superfamily II DNA or RNA helicase
VPHSKHIAERFNDVGIKVEHLDAQTPKADRNEILARLASGETQGVTNVGILTEGFDCPDVGCVILARPTKSFGLYRQMCGRGLRPAAGKTDVIILDHSGAIYRTDCRKIRSSGLSALTGKRKPRRTRMPSRISSHPSALWNAAHAAPSARVAKPVRIAGSSRYGRRGHSCATTAI